MTVLVAAASRHGATWEIAGAIADDHRATRRARPVWLFGSGPVAEGPLAAEEDAVLVAGVTADLGASGQRRTGGRPEQAGVAACGLRAPLAPALLPRGRRRRAGRPTGRVRSSLPAGTPAAAVGTEA
jgi:hypothetical protein